MGRLNDLSGQTFGFITVSDRAGSNKHGQATFNGICHAKNCGKKIVVSGAELTHKKHPKTHCGCLNVNDLSGQTFGFITVNDRAGSDKHDKATFNGICHAKNCGKKIVVAGAELTRKKNPKTHCGCLNVNDLSGQKFGNLFVLKRVKNDKWNCAQFLTRCDVKDCGKKIVVSGLRLINKKYPMTHCGCLSNQHNSDAKKGKNMGCLSPNYKHGLHGTPEYNCEQQHRRRVKKQNNNAGVNLSYAESLEMSRPKLDYCVYCGSTDNLSTDHIIPIDKGGSQNPKNLIRACKSCNSSKNNLFFIDWYLKTKRCTRSLIEIITDMGFDSIYHLQNYQDAMCPKYVEENIATKVRKLLRAEKKSIWLLNRYYQSLDHYPTH